MNNFRALIRKTLTGKLALTLLVSALIPLQTHAAEDEAGFTDSFWFEPGLACAMGAAGGYALSKKGDEVAYSAAGCVATGGIMYLINSYYDNKVAKNKDREIKKLRELIKFQEAIQAQKAAKGDPNETYSIRVQEVVPAQKLPDGSVIAPTIKENLVVPNERLEVGY